MTVRSQRTMSPGLSASVTEAMALSDSTFCKRYRGTSELILDMHSEGEELRDKDTNEGREDKTLDVDDEREGLDDDGHGLDDEDHGLEDEGLGLEEEDEVVPEDQQLATNTVMGEPLGLGYGALRRSELGVEEDRVLSTFEPISSSSPVVLSPIALPVATAIATISVDEDQFLKVGAQLELHRSILQDHTQCLDALPPTLFTDIDRDVRELYTRPGVVRGHVDTRMKDMSQAVYDDHRLIHDMLVQQAAMQRKLQEVRGHVTALKQEQ
ncbi:hypothetical protein Tco_1180290 [Tanacetum coccineum]